jgi:hypothetical protein
MIGLFFKLFLPKIGLAKLFWERVSKLGIIFGEILSLAQQPVTLSGGGGGSKQPIHAHSRTQSRDPGKRALYFLRYVVGSIVLLSFLLYFLSYLTTLYSPFARKPLLQDLLGGGRNVFY